MQSVFPGSMGRSRQPYSEVMLEREQASWRRREACAKICFALASRGILSDTDAIAQPGMTPRFLTGLFDICRAPFLNMQKAQLVLPIKSAETCSQLSAAQKIGRPA